MANVFQIGDKVNTVRGKKVYTITGQDVHGNYTMAEGGKFAGSYLRPAKLNPAQPINQVSTFFRKAAEIKWEAK